MLIRVAGDVIFQLVRSQYLMIKSENGILNQLSLHILGIRVYRVEIALPCTTQLRWGSVLCNREKPATVMIWERFRVNNLSPVQCSVVNAPCSHGNA
ncbi:hypothetical protein Poly41_22010 [Novipirellula artificiosorum]|uniref:Uncharacterized protein n=1 Tax=Novipirellula artificiosorum TaxID=2528016 RepID=A0A5C6DTZ7_9BACT|nr:hypothetical protein Poly41_22010 [Novipirellula artificiosorum]